MGASWSHRLSNESFFSAPPLKCISLGRSVIEVMVRICAVSLALVSALQTCLTMRLAGQVQVIPVKDRLRSRS